MMREDGKLNVLVSYPYLSKCVCDILKDRDDVRVLVDSGAFTAHRSGNSISLSSYCNTLERLPFKPWRYFNLDVVGDWRASRTNFIAMRRAGFEPVGIYHRGAPLEEMEFYYEHDSLMGIGGMKGKGTQQYLNAMMKRIGGRAVHWLGYTDAAFLKFYKPYSCDSSSFAMAAIFGNMHLFLADGERVYLRRDRLHKHLTPEAVATVRALGHDPSILHYADAWKGLRSWAFHLGAMSAVSHMRNCARELGTLYFTATNHDTTNLNYLLSAWDAVERRAP